MTIVNAREYQNNQNHNVYHLFVSWTKTPTPKTPRYLVSVTIYEFTQHLKLAN